MENATGLAFVVLWASASVAAKKGFVHAAPLTVLTLRFALAAALLLGWHQLIRRHPLPPRSTWGPLVILGLGNSTIYLGLSWLALREVSAGLYTLCIAVNPFLIALASQRWLARRVTRQEWTGMAVGFVGLLVATVPALDGARATVKGMVMIIIAMITFSLTAVYRRRTPLPLGPDVINGWQIAVGAITLFPFALAFRHTRPTVWSNELIAALVWAVIPVSIVANGLLLRMQAKDPVRAGTWLLLTPIFGYLEASAVLHEPIHATDLVGVSLVLAGLVVAGTLDLGSLRRSYAERP